MLGTHSQNVAIAILVKPLNKKSHAMEHVDDDGGDDN